MVEEKKRHDAELTQANERVKTYMTDKQWQAMEKLCARYNAEPIVLERSENLGVMEVRKMKFNCATDISNEEKAAIIRCLPVDCSTEFVQSPKSATIKAIKGILAMKNLSVRIGYDQDTRDLELMATKTENPLGAVLVVMPGVGAGLMNMELSDQFWKEFSYTLKYDGAIDTWRISCSDPEINIEADLRDLKPRESNQPEAEKESGTFPQFGDDEEVPAEDNLPSPPADAPSAEVIKHVDKTMASKEVRKIIAKDAKATKPNVKIDQDKLTDLHIDLERANTVDDFLKMIEGGK